MGLLRTALIFGLGYAVGDANRRRQLVSKANDLARRPEVQRLQDRGRRAVAQVTRRTSAESGQEAAAAGTNGAAGARPVQAAVKEAGATPMTAESPRGTAAPDPGTAPAPDGPGFLERQNPVEKVSPDTTADAPATDAGLISTDPSRSEERPSS